MRDVVVDANCEYDGLTVSRVWNSRTHIHNGLRFLAGASIQAGQTEVDVFDGDAELYRLMKQAGCKRVGLG